MNDQAFIQHFAKVRDYLFALPLAKEDLAPLLSKDVVEQQKFLFMRLAYSFFPLYPELREEERTALSAASYLSAIAVYAIDNVLDLQISGKAIRPFYRRSHLYFMESQRILCTLFAHNAPFWITYYSRYEDHWPASSSSCNWMYLPCWVIRGYIQRVFWIRYGNHHWLCHPLLMGDCAVLDFVIAVC
jgi:hypothetical protein